MKKSTEEDRSKKALECFTYVKRTFVLTFLLVFVTSALMYGTTERISVKTMNVFQSNFRPMSGMAINRDSVIRSEIQLGDSTYSNGSDTGFRNPSVVQYKPPSPVKPPTGNNIPQPKPAIPQPKPAIVSKSEDYLIKNLPGKLTGLVPLKPGEIESKEFPGMPDACAAPRRSTGVEDVLCMEPPKFLPEYKNPCWNDENGVFRCLPYFHLIGICKSGTSDFFKRLLKHPDIVPNRGIFGKEIWYWSWKRFFTKDKRTGRQKKGMTLKEFTEQFQTSIIKSGVDERGYHNKVTGHGDPMDIWDRFREDLTPQNTPGAEEHLWTTPYAVRHINPNVKLILMLRDPVDRLYSHYFHAGYGTSAQTFHSHIVASIKTWKDCLNGHTIRHCIYSQPFMKSLKAPLHTSFYIVHLREWMKVFPREQLYIFRNEDYTKDMKGTISNICGYLNVSVPSEKVLDEMSIQPHFYATKKKALAGPMLPETKKLLVDLYRPYTEELARFLNDDKFAWRDKSFA